MRDIVKMAGTITLVALAGVVLVVGRQTAAPTDLEGAELPLTVLAATVGFGLDVWRAKRRGRRAAAESRASRSGPSMSEAEAVERAEQLHARGSNQLHLTWR